LRRVISVVSRLGSAVRALRGVQLALCGLLCLGAAARAEDLSLTKLLAQGDTLNGKHESRAALQVYLQAEKLFPTNAEVQMKLAEAYMNLMHGAKSKAEEKTLAAQALVCGEKAAADDARSARAHVCVAVGYAKNFPYLDNQTKINYSRLIKVEAEKAIALDPKFDLPYHMLGRWNCEVANMNLFLTGLVEIVYGGLPKASNDKAIENFKKAIELAPARIIHHLQLARVYHIVGEKKLMTAELKACAGFAPVDLDDGDAQRIAAKVLETGKWPAEF
jgi:tetratricopeptide (TPR) repeat protein